MKTIISIIPIHLLLALVVLLQGCVVPFPMPSEPTQTYIPKKALSFLEAGETSRADVQVMLGSPRAANEDDSEWIYKLKDGESGRWGICVAMPNGEFDCGEVRKAKNFSVLLKIDFDDGGIVIDWDRYKGELPRRTEYVRAYGTLEKRHGLLFQSNSNESYTGHHERFHDNGQLAERVSIRDGYEDGVHAMYDANGKLWKEKNYKNGRLDGPLTTWFVTGAKMSEEVYKDNERHGPTTQWDPYGDVVLQTCYTEGEMVPVAADDCTY